MVASAIWKLITCTSDHEFFNDAKFAAVRLIINNIKGNVREQNTRNITALTSRSFPFTFFVKNFNFRNGKEIILKSVICI